MLLILIIIISVIIGIIANGNGVGAGVGDTLLDINVELQPNYLYVSQVMTCKIL